MLIIFYTNFTLKNFICFGAKMQLKIQVLMKRTGSIFRGTTQSLYIRSRCESQWDGGEKQILFGLAPLYKPWSTYFYLENLLYITANIQGMRHFG
jgi:hypothetical protein